MKDFYIFAGEHPLLVFALACVISSIIYYPFSLIHRWIRHRNIVAKGWPTMPNMDADGDIVHPENNEE